MLWRSVRRRYGFQRKPRTDRFPVSYLVDGKRCPLYRFHLNRNGNRTGFQKIDSLRTAARIPKFTVEAPAKLYSVPIKSSGSSLAQRAGDWASNLNAGLSC